MSEKESTTSSCLPTPEAHHMDCCDICGATGVTDAIITCSHCKINCEHMYCMRVRIEDHSHEWQCGECEYNSKQKPVTISLEGHTIDEPLLKNRKLLNESRGLSFPWEKRVATGKTKYLSTQEAIQLSSGVNNSSASGSVLHHLKIPRTERKPIKPWTVQRAGSALGHLAQPKPQRNAEVHERGRQKFKALSDLQRPVSNLNPSQAPTNKQMKEGWPREVQSPQAKARVLVKPPSSAPRPRPRPPPPKPNASPYNIPGGTGSTTIQQRTSNAENVNNNILPDLDKCPYSPALDALWKGNFSILDDHRHGKLNHQIRAHPPSKVRRKIYEFMKQMPEVLQFELVPLKESWINLFKEFIPDERDIGLYFFPSAGERSEDYISLLESISAKNLALRKQIADVELLIFTSKLLSVNLQYWEGKNFLWGVFHRLKQNRAAQPETNRPRDPLQPSGGGQNQASNEVDMDIDMVGSILVGTRDIPVQRGPLADKCFVFELDSAGPTSRPGIENPIDSISRLVSDRGKIAPLVEVKVEETNVPPGFEEVHRMKVEGGLKKIGARQGESRKGNRPRCFPRSFRGKLNSDDL